MLLLGTDQEIGALPALRPFYQAWAISGFLRIGVCHPNTRIYVRLLGPCFKTGRISPVARHDPGQNAASRDARRAVIRSSTNAQPGKSAVSEDGGVPLGWALDDRAPERRGEPADGKED